MAKIDDLLSKPKMMGVPRFFNKLYSKLPHLPKKITKFLVWLFPWLALLSGIIGIVAGPIMALLGLISLVTLKPLIILSYVSSAIIMILNTILMWKAFKSFRKKQYRAWYFLFWSNILWFIDGLIEVITEGSSLLGLIIGNIIGFYILFEMERQMRERPIASKEE